MCIRDRRYDEAFKAGAVRMVTEQGRPSREVGQMGQNYLRSLFAVGFQGMLILVCLSLIHS